VFLPVPHDKLPHEPLRLAVVMTGRRTPNYWDDPLDQKPALLDFFDLKGVLEAMLDELHLGGVEVRAAKRPHLHPGRAAELRLAEQVVGTLGELHPKTAQAFDLTERAVLVAELDLDTLLAQVPARFAARAVPRFPAALRDIAVIVAEEVPAGRVEAEIRAAGGELVSAVRLFDVYRGPSIPAGTKSLAYALVYQASDRTLKDAEVDKAHKKIMDRLRHLLQAKIRGIDVVTG
jgi:phenylalanyl-tRNA synthetase beta chain